MGAGNPNIVEIGRATQFKPGQVASPNGRGKGTRDRSTIARKWLQAIKKLTPTEIKALELDGNSDGITYEDLMTIKQIAKAIDQSDTGAYKAVLDSGYGAPVQQVEQTNISETIVNIGGDDDGTEEVRETPTT